MRGLTALAGAAALVGGVLADDPIVVYYYTQWSVWVRKFCANELGEAGQFRGITHVQYAFHYPNDNCELATPDKESDFGGNGWQLPCEIQCIGDLKWDERIPGKDRGNVGCLHKLAAEHGFKIGISLGGWTLSSNFSKCVATPQNRQKFIDSIVHDVNEYGWDFVDFDWEYPYGGGNDGFIGRIEDWENFMTFIEELKAKSDVQLAAALGMNPNLLEGTGNYQHPTPISFLCDKLDYVSLMTYDFMGGWDTPTGWPAPVYHDPAATYNMADKLTIEWGLKKFKEECGDKFSKVVLGLPAYGKAWRQVPAGPDGNGLYESCTATSGGPFWDMPCLGDGSFRDSPGTLEIWDIELNYLKDPRCTHYFHDIAKQDFVYCKETMYHDGSGPIWFAYDGPEAFFEKTRMAKSMGAGGFMIWEPGYCKLGDLVSYDEMPGNKGSATRTNLAAHPDGYFWKEYEDAMFDGWNGGSIDSHRSKGQRVGDGSNIPDPTTGPTKEPSDTTKAPDTTKEAPAPVDTTPAAPPVNTTPARPPVSPGLADCHEVITASLDGDGDVHESCLMNYCTSACAHFVSTTCSSDPSNECVAEAFMSLPPENGVGITCIFASM